MLEAVPVALRFPSVKLESVEETETPEPICTGSPLPFIMPVCKKISPKVRVCVL